MSIYPLNDSEAFVFSICKGSFLSLWCYNNPKGKGGNELCDILVVCDPHVIVISVKDISFKRNNQIDDYKRWKRKAIDASIRQIYGAAHWLESSSQVIRNDGSPGLNLPHIMERRVHRIAVAFGGQDVVPITSGDFGKGFVHVMSERSFNEVLRELDTISDFVDYLDASESYAKSGTSIIGEGSESNLLGWYLFNERSFPIQHDMAILDNTIWHGLRGRPEFKRRKEADEESYFWDRLIEELSNPNAKPIGELGAELSEIELVLRVMAHENRFYRRGLGRHAHEFFEQAVAGRLRSRILSSPSGIIYVFVYFSDKDDLQYQGVELKARCIIARKKIGHGDTIVGIGISKYIKNKGSVSTLCYVKCPDWCGADDEMAIDMQSSMKYFANATIHHAHEDEYPEA